MRCFMGVKSPDYKKGFQDAWIFAMDIFETRGNAIYARKWLRRKDIKLVAAILDAGFRARDKLTELGPRGMDLIRCSDGSFEFREKVKKKEKKHENSPRTDSGAGHEL